MRATLSLYRHFIGARVRAQMQYRTSFAIDSINMFFATFLDFVEVIVLFRFFPALQGWSIAEVALLYGVSGIGFAIADLFVGHIEDIHQIIRSGQFDSLLLRPAGSLFQVVASDLALRRLGKAMQALAVLIWAMTQVDVGWGVRELTLLVGAVLGAATIFAALFIITACVQFFVLGAGEVANGFTYGGQYATQYPMSIFGRWLRRFMAYGIGLAFVAYLPVLAILDRTEPFALSGWLRLASPLVGLAMLCTARVVWDISVRHYRSTGS